MKLVFISNALNHHQVSLCLGFQKIFESFVFIATEDSKTFGYQASCEAGYVLRYYDSVEKKLAEQAILDADVAIIGSCPQELLELRMNTNKTSFLYSERFLKKGVWRRFIPTTYRKIYTRLLQYKESNMYVLCASAYLAYELSLLGYPVNKCFKWGYFPEVRSYDSWEELLSKKQNKRIRMIWVARFLKLKHPEHVVRVAQQLKKAGYDFQLDMIGDGPEFGRMTAMVKRLGLSECVHLLGSFSPEQVRDHMERSDIFLFTSDFREGWGAVINEAMNSGCAVVASHAAGATPFLIKGGVNGFIYESGNVNNMFDRLRFLLDRPSEIHRMAHNAFTTITEEWNAATAAERIKSIAELISAGRMGVHYDQDVCSETPVLKNNWLKSF